ncbi:MAG: DNA primase, partial [Candidatus Methylomirabilis sp.]|nr:DNA primase [Deltaproteobacteria bacterium]
MSTPFDSAKRDVRDRLPISEVVGEYVRLQRAGAGGRWKGLCPFHEEKTPSFTVSDEKGFYYCFGCQAHGDVFSFWMQQESASFPEALRALAERAGVALPAFNPERRAAQASKEDALFGVAEAAAAFYHGLLLKGGEGEPGR